MLEGAPDPGGPPRVSMEEGVDAPMGGRARPPRRPDRRSAPADGRPPITWDDRTEWDHHRFVGAVEQTCRLDREQTQRLVTATLRTLSETLTPSEARRLARCLPAAIAPFLGAGPELQRMETLSEEEFLRRVMIRAGLTAADDWDGRRIAAAIGAVLEVVRAAAWPDLAAGFLDPARPDRTRDDEEGGTTPGGCPSPGSGRQRGGPDGVPGGRPGPVARSAARRG